MEITTYLREPQILLGGINLLYIFWCSSLSHLPSREYYQNEVSNPVEEDC